MNYILLLSFLFILGISRGEIVYSIEDEEFDYKKDIFYIDDRNMKEISKNNKAYSFVVLFATDDEIYQCANCPSLIAELSLYQQGYYKLEESESNPIIFSIARPEDGRRYFDTNKVGFVPYLHIRMKTSKPGKPVIIEQPKTEMLDSTFLVSWLNEQFHMKVRTPISDDTKRSFIFFTSCFIIIFSLLFPMGKGLWRYINTRSAYMKVCLIVVFLCMSCLPYIMIKSPIPYSEDYNRKRKLIYHFFSDGENKYTFEGFIFAFWVGVVFFCCYGFVFFLQKYSNSLLSSFVIAILLGIFIVSILEIKRDVEYSMPFINEELAYTKSILFGRQPCVFCKRYVDYLKGIQKKKKSEWILYFSKIKDSFKKCFQFCVCFMEFDFSSNTSDKPKRGPPKRFLIRNAPQEAIPPNPTKQTEEKKIQNEIKRRFVPSTPCKDSTTTYTNEYAIEALEQLIPDFSSKNSTIETSTKWKDKVDTFQTIQTYVKENASSCRQYNEAFILYGLKYTNQCNASNVNIMRSGLEFFKQIVSLFGIGFRMTSTIVPCLLNKIQDKALYSDIAEVLLLISEKVGPDVVMSTIFSSMKNNKKVVQQKAVLQWLLQVLIDFGAIHLNVKNLIQYLQLPQALQSTTPDVKNAAISIITELYKQLGTVVLDLVNQFELPELQLKRIRDELAAIQLDVDYQRQYQQSEVKLPSSTQPSSLPSGMNSVPPLASSSLPQAGPSSQSLPSANHTTSSQQVPAPTPTPTPTPTPAATGFGSFSLSSLIEPVDISSSLPPILSNLQDTEGKESWKNRQEGVDSLLSLLESKPLVKNTESIQQVLNALKMRLNESNLNLRAKMIQAIGLIANRIGVDVQQYSQVIIPEVVKNINDSKQQVVDATFTTLSRWVIHQDQVQPSIVIPLLPFFPTAVKTSKSRQRLFQWFLDIIPSCEGKDIRPIIPIILDGLLDKVKDTRTAATSLLSVILTKWSSEPFLREAAKRKPIDATQLKTLIQTISPLQASYEEPEESPAATPTPAAKTVDMNEQRKTALARRPGAQVLHKRKLGPDGKPIPKFNVQSSIPKPMPRISRQASKQEPPPVITQPVLPYQPTQDYTLNSPLSIDSVEKLPESIPPSPKKELCESEDIREEDLPNETPDNETPDNEPSVLLHAVSFGISMNQTELLFDDENDEKKNILQVDDTAFSHSFISMVTDYFNEEKVELQKEEEIMNAVQSIIKACYPVYPVETGLLVNQDDLQALCEKKQQWFIPLCLSFLPHSSYQTVMLNLLFCIVTPSSSLSQMVAGFSIDEITIHLQSIIPLFFEDSVSRPLLSCILELLIKQASIVPFIWAFLHFSLSKQQHFSNTSFYQLLEVCITQIHKRVENESSVALDESEVDTLLGLSKKALPSSLASQIEVCVLCLPKKEKSDRNMDGIKKDVVLPSYLQHIIDNRVLQRKTSQDTSSERIEGDVDQRMALLRQRMRQLQRR